MNCTQKNGIDHLCLTRKIGSFGFLPGKQAEASKIKGFNDYIKARKEENANRCLQRKHLCHRIKHGSQNSIPETSNEKLERLLQGEYLKRIEGELHNNKTCQWLQIGRKPNI